VKFFAAQRYAVARAAAMVGDRPFAFLLGVALAALALALPLTLASVGWAVWPVATRLPPVPEVSVFIAPRATARDVEQLKIRLGQRPGVSAVTLRSKDAALAQLAKQAGFSGLPGEIGANPLPDVLIARLPATTSPAALDSLAAEARSWPLVDAVRSDIDWLRKLRAVGKLAAVATAVFGGIAVVLLALVLLGTTRLHAAARSDEIAVLTLGGATPRFIVRPYAYSAALTLLTGAALASGVVYLAHAALRAPLSEVTTLYGGPWTLADPDPVHLAIFWAGAGFFGWLVGWVGARSALVTAGH
jgi:cell division transport system permease protein